MRSYKKLIAPVLAIVLLAACERGLPPSVKRDVSLETDRVHNAERQVAKSQASLNASVAQFPDLFRGASEVAAWKASISEAQASLQTAESDGRELAKLIEQGRPDVRISSILGSERRLREGALEKTQSVDGAVAKWNDYGRDPAGFVARMNHERDSVRAFDVTPVTEAVRKAELDWPAKKPALESRLSSLMGSATTAEVPAQSSPSALIAEEDALSRQANTLGEKSKELENECGQLYNSWDRILTDLDRSDLDGDKLYRERLKVVRTHFTNVPLKLSQTESEEHWTDVSESSYHAVESDIGMTIAHKDAGLFDSEAQNTPQPAGFSYVASPSVGSNEYGYWSHSGGASVWTFLPQYLILRELLWNHDYRPVMASEYNAYRYAQSRGITYYGRETPTAAPKYGTHGTFTQTHYASSRYVQSGGFKGSAYASGGSTGSSGTSLLNKLRQGAPAGSAVGSDGGRRFGRQPSSAPLGHQFGHPPSSHAPGRAFGRRH